MSARLSEVDPEVDASVSLPYEHASGSMMAQRDGWSARDDQASSQPQTTPDSPAFAPGSPIEASFAPRDASAADTGLEADSTPASAVLEALPAFFGREDDRSGDFDDRAEESVPKADAAGVEQDAAAVAPEAAAGPEGAPPPAHASLPPLPEGLLAATAPLEATAMDDAARAEASEEAVESALPGLDGLGGLLDGLLPGPSSAAAAQGTDAACEGFDTTDFRALGTASGDLADALSRLVDGLRDGPEDAPEAMESVHAAGAAAERDVATEGSAASADVEHAATEAAGAVDEAAEAEASVVTATRDADADAAMVEGAAAAESVVVSAEGARTQVSGGAAPPPTLESVSADLTAELDQRIEDIALERTAQKAEVDVAIDAELGELRSQGEAERLTLDDHIAESQARIHAHRLSEVERLAADRDHQLLELANHHTAESERTIVAADQHTASVVHATQAELARVESTTAASVQAVWNDANARAATATGAALTAADIQASAEARGQEIASGAAANRAAIQAHCDQVVATIATDRERTLAALQASHDAAVTEAHQRHDTMLSAIRSDERLYNASQLQEANAARAELAEAQAAAEASLEARRVEEHADIDARLDALLEGLEARRTALEEDLLSADEGDAAELQAELDALLEAVDERVDESLAAIEARVGRVVEEIRIQGDAEIAQLTSARDAALARVTAQMESETASLTSAVDFASGQIQSTVAGAVSDISAVAAAGGGLIGESGTSGLLDIATLGQATVEAFGERSQTALLAGELAARQGGLDYDAIELDHETGDVRLVQQSLNGRTTEYTLSDTDLTDGDAAFSWSTAHTEPGETRASAGSVGISYGRDGQYGVQSSFAVTSGEGDARESAQVGFGAAFSSDAVSGRVDWGWQSGEGAEAVGGQESRAFGVGADGVSYASSSVETLGGEAHHGQAVSYAVGRDGVELGGDLYRNGVGFGGNLGVDWENGSVSAGARLSGRGFSGGGGYARTEDGWDVSGSLGHSPAGRGYGASVSGSYGRDTDVASYALVNDQAGGGAGFARDVIGEDLLSHGLSDESRWSVGLNANMRAAQVGFSHAEQDGSSVQFMQTADAVDLSSELAPLLAIHDDEQWAREHWIRQNPDAFAERLEAQSGARLDGVNGPQDVGFTTHNDAGEHVLDASVLGRGTAWSFSTNGSSSTSGTLGLYGLGLTLGGSADDHQELTVARTGDGEDQIVVQFSTMERDGSMAGFGATDLLEAGMSASVAANRSVEFALDPTEPDDMAALQELTTTGMLPGASEALEAADRTRYQDIYARLDQGETLSSDDRDTLTELASRANTAFMDDDDFLLGDDYRRRQESLTVQNQVDISALGFSIASGGWSESWSSTDYHDDGGAQQRELAYDYMGQESRFLGWTTRDAESSFLSVNPEVAGGLALVGGSEWRMTADQAEQMGAMGIAGADAWRMQGVADGALHNFTAIGRASMAMDDAMLSETLDYFGGQDLSAMWAGVADDLWADNEVWLSHLMGEDASGMSYRSSQEMMMLQMDATPFVDHSDPEALLQLSPMQVLQEQARRDAWRANADEILELVNRQVPDAEYEDIDALMDALARDEVSDEDRPYWNLSSAGLESTLNSVAANAYGESMERSITAISGVRQPDDFAGLSVEQQEAWLHLYATTSDTNAWFALDMIEAATTAREEEHHPSDGLNADGLRDRLIRRLFRETELSTGDRDTATMQYVEFIGELESRGAEGAALANTLKDGVYVTVVDEGVVANSREAGGAILAGHLDVGSDFVSSTDKEVRHLLDNWDDGEAQRHMNDADDLMDRLEGLRMAAGADHARVVEAWVAHAASVSTGDFPRPAGMSAEEAFVAHIAALMAPNDEYVWKLEEFFEGTAYAGASR